MITISYLICADNDTGQHKELSSPEFMSLITLFPTLPADMCSFQLLIVENGVPRHAYGTCSSANRIDARTTFYDKLKRIYLHSPKPSRLCQR